MLLLIGLLLFASTAFAQNVADAADHAPAPSMTFDVISIRPIKMEPGHFYDMMDGGFQPLNSSHYRMKSVNLLSLLGSAFSLKYYQLPLSSLQQFSPPIPRLYTIEANCDDDTDKRLAELPKVQREAEQRHMLQALLEDRFHLKFHWEDRLLPGYRLLVDKHGAKLLPAGSLPRDSNGYKWNSNDEDTYQVHRDDLHGRLYVARGASMEVIVGIAYVRTMSPVQDETGLHGTYDFDFKFGDKSANPEENPQAWPQLTDALQSELGLRLEPAQIMQKVLVIDHLERPTEN